MARNEFEKEVGDLLSKYFPLSIRIKDVAFNRSGGRQVSQNPFDFVGATEDGIIWAAEAKRVREMRFPNINLKEHQRYYLDLTCEIGGYGLLFINWRVQPAIKNGNVATMIDYKLYSKIEKSSSRKSTAPWMMPKYTLLERIAGGWRIPSTHYLKHLI